MSWLDVLAEIRRKDWSEATPELRASSAREVVEIAAYGGCLANLIPIPLADLAIMVPVHSAMVMTVGHIYGRDINQTEAKRVALELGAVAGLSFASASALGALKKLLLPGVGGLLTLPATFALTTGIGRVAIAYFSTPNVAREDLRRTFEETLREARAWFSMEAFERFRAQYGGGRGADADAPREEEGASVPTSPPGPPAGASPTTGATPGPSAPPAETTTAPGSSSTPPPNDSLRRPKRTL